MSRTRQFFYTKLALSFVLALAAHISRLDAQKIGSVEREANAQAQNLIKKIVQSGCGIDFFSKKHYSGSSLSGSSTYYWQYKGLTWSIVPAQLSEADELNGIEFRGDLIIKARVFRLYSDGSSMGSSPGWGSWQDFKDRSIKFRLEKKGGKWSNLSESSSQEIGDEAPSCEELKQIVPGIAQQKQKG